MIKFAGARASERERRRDGEIDRQIDRQTYEERGAGGGGAGMM